METSEPIKIMFSVAAMVAIGLLLTMIPKLFEEQGK